MRQYKDVLVGKNSLLAAALIANNKKLAEKIYKETTAKYCAMYSKEDRDWFANWRQDNVTQ